MSEPLITVSFTRREAECLAILAREGRVALDLVRPISASALSTPLRRQAAVTALRRLKSELATSTETRP